MLVQERELGPEEQAILGYLEDHPKATTKDIADNVEGIPKNRSIVENYLTKLFAKDEVMMAREGRARIWMKNHITVRMQRKPLAWAVLPQDNEYGRRKLWFDLHRNVSGDDYIWIQESKHIEGEGWVNKGGIVLPLDTLTDFVANLLKIALKSDQYRDDYPQIAEEQKTFLNQISQHAGVQVK